MATTSQRAARVLTYEDYLGFPADGNRHELLEGEHTMTPAPSLYHQYAAGKLAYYFQLQVKEGVAFGAPIDVILAPSTIAQPDVSYFGPAKRELLTRRGSEGAPDIVVEILSPGSVRYDLGKKRELYARYGVGEYWIVDPDEQTIRVCTLEQGEYPVAGERLVGRSDVLTSPLAPGLAVPVGELFWLEKEDR